MDAQRFPWHDKQPHTVKYRAATLNRPWRATPAKVVTIVALLLVGCLSDMSARVCTLPNTHWNGNRCVGPDGNFTAEQEKLQCQMARRNVFGQCVGAAGSVPDECCETTTNTK